jgi:hypothetical protein
MPAVPAALDAGSSERQELDVRVVELQQPVDIPSADRFKAAPHDLDVLLRHRPRSIAPEEDRRTRPTCPDWRLAQCSGRRGCASRSLPARPAMIRRATTGNRLISDEKLREVSTSRCISVLAVTVAERGPWSRRDISPTTSPGPSGADRLPRRDAVAWPSAITKHSRPGSPWRVRTLPSGTSISSTSTAIRPKSRLLQVAKRGTLLRSSIFVSLLRLPNRELRIRRAIQDVISHLGVALRNGSHS